MNSFNEAVSLFLNNSGWVTALTEAEVASLGSAEYTASLKGGKLIN
jgi:hypothetical protein